MSLPNITRRAATVLIAAVVLVPTLAWAETGDSVATPRSRYALPEPVTREPDVDDLIYGNGKLHFSGQWRHPGDSRNSGELMQMLLAPQTVQGPRRTPNGLPSSRFCSDNPDRC